jgi:hypothetical protein
VSPSLALAIFRKVGDKHMFRSSRFLGLGLIVALAAAPARAADLDPYLPPDTEVVNIINVRQVLSSALVKQVGIENIKAMMGQAEELTTVLKDLGLDPFKDVDKIISAGPGSGDQDKGLMIVRGRFDVDKWKARARKAAREQKDVVKAHKVKDGQGGEHEIFEVALAEALPQAPGGLSLYVGFANKNVILGSASKDYLIDGLKIKDDATKATLKNKEFAGMLTRLDDKQSLAIAMIGDVLTKGQLAEAPDVVKDLLKTVTAASGGFTVTDGVKVEFSVSTKEVGDARKIKDTLSDGLNTAIGFAALAAMQQKELQIAVDFLKSVKVTSRDKGVSLKAELTGDDLGKFIPKDQ